MAIVTCKECKAPISSAAAACPKCGFTTTARSKTSSASKGCLLIVVGTFSVVALFAHLQRRADQNTTPEMRAQRIQAAAERDAIYSAIGSARQAVGLKMRDPGTLQWRSVTAHKSPDGTLFVCGHVNAKNAFGAYTGFAPFIWVNHEVVVESTAGEISEEWNKSCAKWPIVHRSSDR